MTGRAPASNLDALFVNDPDYGFVWKTCEQVVLQVISKSTRISSTNCLIIPFGAIPNLVEDNGYPVIRVQVNKKSFCILFHHFLLFYYQGNWLWQKQPDGSFKYFPNLERGEIDLSHECHVKSCAAYQHYVFEPVSINFYDRNECLKNQECTGHVDYDGKPLPDCIFHPDIAELQVHYDEARWNKMVSPAQKKAMAATWKPLCERLGLLFAQTNKHRFSSYFLTKPEGHTKFDFQHVPLDCDPNPPGAFNIWQNTPSEYEVDSELEPIQGPTRPNLFSSEVVPDDRPLEDYGVLVYDNYEDCDMIIDLNGDADQVPIPAYLYERVDHESAESMDEDFD